MDAIFKVLALFLLLLGSMWVAVDVVRFAYEPPPQEVLGFGPGFAGSAKLPLQVIQAKFAVAQSRLHEAQSHSRAYAGAGTLCKWIAIFATAAVAVVLGFFGQARATDPAVLPIGTNTVPLTRRSIRLVGGLAAIASVLTGLSGEFKQQAVESAARGESLHRLLVDSRKQVQDAPTATAAQRVLDELDYEVNKQ